MTTQSPHDDDPRTPERSRYNVDPPDEAYDPYRYGAPEHPVAPQYAPPGYQPPPTYPPPGEPPPPPNGYGPPPYYGAPPNYQYPPPRTGNGKAIAALVLGILSIVFCAASFFDLVLIIPAIVLGSIALNEAKHTHAGRSVAIGGLVCAIIGAAAAIAITVWLYPKVANCANDYQSGSSEYNTCIRHIVQ
jgi:hypothetical protein